MIELTDGTVLENRFLLSTAAQNVKPEFLFCIFVSTGDTMRLQNADAAFDLQLSKLKQAEYLNELKANASAIEKFHIQKM